MSQIQCLESLIKNDRFRSQLNKPHSEPEGLRPVPLEDPQRLDMADPHHMLSNAWKLTGRKVSVDGDMSHLRG